jgi:hypothetical protein
MDGFAACWTNAGKALWRGKPDEKIGVDVFHATHGARSAGRIPVWKRESQSMLTETASATRDAETKEYPHMKVEH